MLDLRSAGYLSVEPGDFAVVTVREEIALGPRHAGRFGLRWKYARKGLIATTGPQIDPGFHGRLILGLTNLTPKAVTLSHDDDLVSVEFHQLAEPTEKPCDGPFQGKTKLGPEEIEMITENSGGMAFSEVLTTLSSLSANVAALSRDVHELSASMKTQRWLVPLLFGFVALLIAVFGFLGA